jgi:hypothetical protein
MKIISHFFLIFITCFFYYYYVIRLLINLVDSGFRIYLLLNLISLMNLE